MHHQIILYLNLKQKKDNNQVILQKVIYWTRTLCIIFKNWKMRPLDVLYLNLYQRNKNLKKTLSLKKNKKFYSLKEKFLIAIYLQITLKINLLIKEIKLIVDPVIIMNMSQVADMLDFLMRDKCYKIVKKKFKKWIFCRYL